MFVRYRRRECRCGEAVFESESLHRTTPTSNVAACVARRVRPFDQLRPVGPLTAIYRWLPVQPLSGGSIEFV